MFSLQMEKSDISTFSNFYPIMTRFFWDSAEDEMVRSANASRLDVYHD